MTNTEREQLCVQIDEALIEWRQGDSVLGEHWFAHRFDSERPITEEACNVWEDGTDLVETEVAGFSVISQTCDIVRSCSDRPYVEVSPLVKVTDDDLHTVKRCRRPRYAYVPGVADRGLVIDLDRVMTVEKSVVAGWERIQGCGDEKEARQLAHALARKRVRFAFPDDFSQAVERLQRLLLGKHDKQSPEGAALRSLREIRIRAAPSWHSRQVSVRFWFIRASGEDNFEGTAWYEFLDKWLGLIEKSERFQDIDGAVVTLDRISAREYAESDPLDLDHLTVRT